MKKFIVSKDNSIYEAWPDIVLTNSGKLICVFSECVHHSDRTDARIMISESTDRGRSWTKKRPLTEKSKKDNYYNCAAISKLNNGTLAIICDRIDGSFKSGERKAVQYLWFSKDDGASWSEPLILPFCGIVPDKLLQLKCGRLLICAHFQSPQTGKLEEYLWFSDDGGKSWSDKVLLASDPRYNLCEASVIECDDGTLVCFLRENSFKGIEIMKAISRDRGETWEGVFPTPLYCGHRPKAGFLKDGRVFITYRFIPNKADSMQNMFAAVLEKNELEVKEIENQHIRVMPIDYDRNPIPDMGYTGWVQFDDGEIYIVNYIKDECEKAYIRGYSLYPDEIVFEKEDNN